MVLPDFGDHTIYKPVNMGAFDAMPVMVWGNGACSDDSLSHQNFLLEIASYGIIVVVSGVPNGAGGGTSAQTMTASIDWAVNNAGQGDWANMDASRIAAAGMSCGGVEAYDNSLDSRVTAVGIFNSGQYDESGTNANVPPIDKPIFFFLGGQEDIAYGNVSLSNPRRRCLADVLRRACETMPLSHLVSQLGLATIPAATAEHTASPTAEHTAAPVRRTSAGFSVVTSRLPLISPRMVRLRMAGPPRARICRM